MNTQTTAAKIAKAPSDTTITGANGATTTVKAKKPRVAKPRLSAAQKRDGILADIASAVSKAAARLQYVSEPGSNDPYVVSVATTNSVLMSLAGALDAKAKITAADVRSIARSFMDAASVEEVESPMGGTTLRRQPKGDAATS